MTRDLATVLRRLGPLLGILLIYAFFLLFGLLEDGTAEPFLRLFHVVNLKTLATHTTIVALSALGMTFVMVSSGIDLSPGSAIALTTVVVALAAKASWCPPLLAAVFGVLAGAAVGLLNGLAVTALRIVPFIVTLGTMGIVRGVAKHLAGNTTVQGVPETWLSGLLSIDRSPDAPPWKLPSGVFLLLVATLAGWVLLRRTVFGRQVFALGSNEATARLCGVPVARVKVLVYTLAGALTGAAGVLQFSRLGVGDPTAAVGIELSVIASVVIGGGSLRGGKGGVWGTLLGAFLMGILRNGCDLYGIQNYVQEIFIGCIIVVAVALDGLREKS